MVDDSLFETYLRRFSGREGYFASQNDSGYAPVRKQFGRYYLNRHLAGHATFGVYVLTVDSKCNFVCIDLDIPKAELDEIDFRDPRAKFSRIGDRLRTILRVLSDEMGVPKNAVLLEDTGGRGYHIWVFITAAIPGGVALGFGRTLKSKLSFQIEYFPKQGRISTAGHLGNLIRLPLGVHRKYGRESTFFRLLENEPVYLSGIDANLLHLSGVPPVDPSLFRQFSHELPEQNERPTNGYRETLEAERQRFEGDIDKLYQGCVALHQIRQKAVNGNSLSHSEAFHFANAILSVKGGEGEVHEVMKSSYRDRYDEQYCNAEIERIKPLHPTSCRTLVGEGLCPGYCKASVAERNRDPLMRSTTPMSVWLHRAIRHPVRPSVDPIELISVPERIEDSFYRLKSYHEHEDALFFDPFDFDHFESRLGARARLLSVAFREQREIPLAGYLKVDIPKKLDSELHLQFRSMAYSTVYDQVPIQTVFDSIAGSVEDSLQSCSYGYRWNVTDSDRTKIFEDWREAYPRFRKYILTAVQNHPEGFHVSCDIKGFYDHIDHSILLEQLRPLLGNAYLFGFVKRVIESYEAEAGGHCGVPQGPSYARLLANLYLNSLDSVGLSTSTAYCRYVDDFFLVFDTYASAEQGMKEIGDELAALNLELSDDEKKRAVIRNNTDLSDIRRTLDKIQYGILEGTRQIRHVDQEMVQEFYDAIERHRGSLADFDQLLSVNDAIPSLLYSMAQEEAGDHPFRRRLFKICELLISRDWFFPKRLKTIFYRFLDLPASEKEFLALFEQMQPAHQTYFLLSVFGLWRRNGTHLSLLITILTEACKSQDPFVGGMALSIATLEQLREYCVVPPLAHVLQNTFQKSWFGAAHVVGSQVLTNPDEEQIDVLRQYLSSTAPKFVVSMFLESVQEPPATYAENLFMSGLIREFHFMFVPGTAAVFAELRDRNELFEATGSFLCSTPSFKSICIDLATTELRQKSADWGIAKLHSVTVLYERIPDDELRRVTLNVINSSELRGVDPGKQFAKEVERVERYDGCFLFEFPRPSDGHLREYIEIVPANGLTNLLGTDVDTARRVLDDCTALSILPRNEFQYDSATDEVSLHYTLSHDYEEPIRGGFALSDDDISRALLIVEDVYKKALYFERLTNRVPLIALSNLLIREHASTILFRTVGHSFGTPLVVAGIRIGNNRAEIPRMIGMLLEGLFFSRDADASEFMKEPQHDAGRAIVLHVIRVMGARDSSRRYSLERLHAIAGAFEKNRMKSKNHITVLYLSERLRARLFSENVSHVGWQGICRALNKHVDDVRGLFSDALLSRVAFRKRMAPHWVALRGIHSLSKDMLSLAMNRDRVRHFESLASNYLDIVEFLLYFAVVCIETISFCRETWHGPILEAGLMKRLLEHEHVTIVAGQYKKSFVTSKIAALSTYRHDDTGTGTEDLTLEQIGLVGLLACGSSWNEPDLFITRPQGMSAHVFDDLCHLCLYRLDRFESTAYKTLDPIFEMLRMGEEFLFASDIVEHRQSAVSILSDLEKVRRRLSIRRHRGVVDGKKFPEKLSCKRFLIPSVETDIHSLPDIALVNKIPAGQPRASWSSRKHQVVNLVVPSYSLYGLLAKLRSGRVLKKFLYRYSGRRMIFIDLPILLFLVTIWGTMNKLALLSQDATFIAATYVVVDWLKWGTFFFAGKLIYDLSHWSEGIRAVVSHVTATLTVKNNDGQNTSKDS